MSRIALQSLVTGKYVCADLENAAKLAADRPWRNEWEIFELISLDGSRVALKAFNGRYVCADFEQQARLTASRSQILAWETFELRTVTAATASTPAQVGLRSVVNDRWICADLTDGGALKASRRWLQNWEMFRLIPVE